MTTIKKIERLESIARLLLDEATDLRKNLAGDKKPVRFSKKDVIAKRLKTALK